MGSMDAVDGPLRKRMKNVDPSPGVLSTQIRPPCAWTILLQIARPTPVPSYSSWVCRRLKS